MNQSKSEGQKSTGLPGDFSEMLESPDSTSCEPQKWPEEISDFSSVTQSAQSVLPNPAEPLPCEWFGSPHSRFSQQAKRVPARTAVADKLQTWSYSELDAASNQLANYLRSCGIGSQDAVAIYAHRSASLVWALLGILKAGAAFVILDSKYPASRLIDCCRLAMPRGWLQLEAAGELPEELEEFVGSLGCVCRLELPQGVAAARQLLKDCDADGPEVGVDPDGLAYIAFTSGSTGKPKGILGTHRPLSHFLEWHIRTFGLRESDRFSMLSGLSHDPLLRDILTPLSLGAAVCIPDPEQTVTPGWLADWMKQQEISVAHLTPAMGQVLTAAIADRVASREWEPVVSLRYAFFGGDILRKQDVELMRALAPNLTCVNFYGATETPQAMGYYIVPNEETGEFAGKEDFPVPSRIPVGRGIQDVQLLVLNSSQELAGIGELGEIYIRTPYLAKGYLGDDALTEERFIANPLAKITGDRLYKTGDLGQYSPDGTISLVGRADNQVKIRGFRIELGELEAVLNAHPGVRQSVALAREDVAGDRRLVAYIVPAQSPFPTAGELRRFLKEKLPDYMVPSALTFLDALPLTPNGKIDRRALPAPDFERPDLEGNFVAPRDAVERQLAQIWENLLGVKQIGIKDNYFDLGGHSLLAVRLFAEIERAFGKNLPINVLLQAQTIEQLAVGLRQEQWSAPWSCLVPIQVGGSKPPLFCVHEADGHILCYRDLARHLGDDQPVYGLQPHGMDGKHPLYSRFEDMAAHFIKEIRSLQPQGPYLLGGLCVGGILAFEIAVQLQAQGQEVALLALFDAALDQAPELEIGDRLDRHLNKFLEMSPKEKLGYIFNKTQGKIQRTVRPYKEKIKLMNYKFYLDKGGFLPFLPAYIPVREVLNTYKYVPQVYSGRVTLFRAAEGTLEWHSDPELGWGPLAAGGVEVYDMPGRHNDVTDMLTEPYVRVLAEKVRACIDRALGERVS